MVELFELETSVLMDMLVAYTSDYTRMMTEGTTQEEFERCSLTIRAIQLEIESRKQTPANTSISDPSILLPD